MEGLFKETTNNLKEILSPFKKIVPGIKKLGPYNSYDLDIIEILPSEEVDNKNNRIILDSFSNLATTSTGFKGIYEQIAHGREPIGLEVFSDGIKTSFHILLPRSNMDFMMHKIYGVTQGSRLRKLEFIEDYMNRFSDNKTSEIFNVMLKDHPVVPYRMDLSPIANSITESFELLKPGDLGCVQILLQPLCYDWQTKFKYAYEQYKYTNTFPVYNNNILKSLGSWLEGILKLAGNIFKSKQIDNRNLDAIHRTANINFESELDKAVKEKINSNGFRTTIKVTVQSIDRYKRSQVARALVSSVTELSRFNTLYMSKSLLKDKAMNDFKSRKITRDNFISCSKEGGNLMSLPDINVHSNLLNKAPIMEEIVDSKVSEGALRLGDTLPYRGETIEVNAPTKSKNEMHKTTLFIAPPGYGKTTIVINNGLERLRLGQGFMAPDIADGEIIEKIIKYADPKYRNKIIVLDFSNEQHLPTFSIQMLQGNYLMKSEMFCEWFAQILQLGVNTPRALVHLTKFTRSCFINPDNGMMELRLLLKGNNDMVASTQAYLKNTNPILYYWWTHDYPQNKDTIVKECEILINRLDTMFENEILGRVFFSNQKPINPREIMDNGEALLLDLSGGKTPPSIQRIIMSFMFLAFWNASLSREDLLRQGKKLKSFAMLLDEPQSYISTTKTIEFAINKFRKYSVALNMFIHGSDQVESESPGLWKSIMNSGPNLILGFASMDTRKKVRYCFEDLNDITLNKMYAKVSNRDDHYFIANMNFDKGKVYPFVFKTIDVAEKRLQAYDNTIVYKNSIEKYAPMTVEEIDNIIGAKLYNKSIDEFRDMFIENEGGEPEWVNKDEENQNEIPLGI